MMVVMESLRNIPYYFRDGGKGKEKKLLKSTSFFWV